MLDRLPQEVGLVVAEKLATSNGRLSFRPAPGCVDALKSLCLVNRNIKAWAEPSLFSVVYLTSKNINQFRRAISEQVDSDLSVDMNETRLNRNGHLV